MKKQKTPTLEEILDRLKPETFLPEHKCPDARAYTRCTNGWHVALLDNGVEEAIERCPEYWRSKGRTVDPSDRLKLLEAEGDSGRRRTAMVDILRGKR